MKLKKFKKAFAVIGAALMLLSIFALGVLAEETGETPTTGGTFEVSDFTDAMGEGLTQIQGDIGTMITSILPYVLAILGMILVVRIGIKLYRSFTMSATGSR